MIWLDDLRDPKTYGYTEALWIKSYKDFTKTILSIGLPELISFDNDLGEEKEGYDCAKWLVEYCIDRNLPLPKCQVHSANPVARNNINSLLNNYKKMENKLVTFGEAIEALKNGSVIYRNIWQGTKLRLVPETGAQDPYIMAILWNGHFASWIPTHDDMLNDDWIIE